MLSKHTRCRVQKRTLEPFKEDRILLEADGSPGSDPFSKRGHAKRISIGFPRMR